MVQACHVPQQPFPNLSSGHPAGWLTPWLPEQLLDHYHHHLSLNHKGCWGTKDDFTTSFLHFSLFSTALWNLPNSRPVHSLKLSSVLVGHCQRVDVFANARTAHYGCHAEKTGRTSLLNSSSCPPSPPPTSNPSSWGTVVTWPLWYLPTFIHVGMPMLYSLPVHTTSG